MRLPFLQVDWDFLATSAGDLAELLRTSEAEAGWAMVRLWGWAITKAATPESLGVLAGDDMQRLAERAAGWKGEPGAFLAAICGPAVALAQRGEDGIIRLSGMDRYAATYRKQESDRARKSRGSRAEVAAPSIGTPTEVARKTQTQTQTQTQRREDPPKAPQGVREPREGDPCEEHQPPATARLPAAAVADASFVPPPIPPKPGEYTLHVAVQVAYELVRPGKRYPWNPVAERKAIATLQGYCAAVGIHDASAQCEEIGRRFARALACTDESELTTAFKRRAATLTGLASLECWGANDTPFEGQVLRFVDGVRKPVRVLLEPWPHAVWRAAA